MDKEHRINVILLILAPSALVVGILLIVIPGGDEPIMRKMLGIILILLGVLVFSLWLTRVISMRSTNADLRKMKTLDKAREKRINDAIGKFETAVDTLDGDTLENDTVKAPEPDTVKLVDAGLEFYVDGRYVCQKDFNGIPGHHLAFEIMSTGLKHKPKNYDDVCDLEGSGILISVGYHDGIALEKYANDNGVILQDTPENSIGQTVTLKFLDGYKFDIQTVENDDIDFGFVKILECDNDVLTVRFLLSVPLGLCDTVEGVVRLKKEPSENDRDIHSLITRFKWRRYNTVEVSAETIETMRQADPFLPESYIEFLREIGFADMNWIDVGFDNKTPTNLSDDCLKLMQNFFANRKGYRLDDYYFFAIDNDGGLYAFSRDPNDKQVYAFSSDKVPHILIYDDFEEFLVEILNT